MSGGLRLRLTRPVPPPPYGYAYLLDASGRILTGHDGALLITEIMPPGLGFAVDEVDAELTDEKGASILVEID